MTIIEELTKDGFAAYGTAIGLAGQDGDAPGGQDSWLNPASDFWHEHDFRTGTDAAQILWVIYRVADPQVQRLEAHTLTQQALLPLTGDVIQIVARSGADGAPDPDSIRAFRLRPGHGIVMAPGCWHATRTEGGAVTCAMLTRRSTTSDLIGHLVRGTTLAETSFAAVDITLQGLGPANPAPGE